MREKTITLTIPMDQAEYYPFQKWAEAEGRTVNQQARIVLSRLSLLRQAHPMELGKVGLCDVMPGALLKPVKPKKPKAVPVQPTTETPPAS